VADAREHLPAEHLEAYETALRQATRRALDSSDDGPLEAVVEQGYRAAFIAVHGGEAWQPVKRRLEEGGWDAAFAGQLSRSFDEVTQKLTR
jgi:hypothetical protein